MNSISADDVREAGLSVFMEDMVSDLKGRSEDVKQRIEILARQAVQAKIESLKSPTGPLDAHHLDRKYNLLRNQIETTLLTESLLVQIQARERFWSNISSAIDGIVHVSGAVAKNAGKIALNVLLASVVKSGGIAGRVAEKLV